MSRGRGASDRSDLWYSDRDSFYAINALAIHNRGRHPAIGTRWHAHGRLVTVAAVGKPYGHTTVRRGARTELSHLTDRVYLVWRDGQLAGWKIRWLCGSQTFAFRLTDQPRWPTLCRNCLFRAGLVDGRVTGPGISIVINLPSA